MLYYGIIKLKAVQNMSNLEKIRQLQNQYRNAPKKEKIIFSGVNGVVIYN